MRKLKIGYWPLSKDLKSPGDRRRLIFWANLHGHEIILDRTKKVDVIVASENSDFNSPYFNHSQVPVIFDLIDAYSIPNNPIEDMLRGLVKHLDKQISGPVKPFSQHVQEFCRKSDAVICSSIEQKELIKQHNGNIHIILDSHEEIRFLAPQLQTNFHPIANQLLWEGQPATIGGVKEIAPILSRLSGEFNLQMSFVTDETYFRYLNKYAKKDTFNLLQKTLLPGVPRIRIHQWSMSNLLMQASQSNLAIIPLNLSIPIQNFKPENRLLIMWRLGLPCLTSMTPAYQRVALQAGVEVVCNNSNDWFEEMNLILSDPEYALNQVVLGQNFLRENHSSEILMRKWDQVFESVIG